MRKNMNLETLTDNELREIIATASAILQARNKKKTAVIRSRYRDLNAKGKGSETFRLVLHDDRLIWASEHPDARIVEDNWTAPGIRAHQRRCSTTVELPVGTLVVEIEKSVGYGKTSVSYSIGLVAVDENGKGKIDWNGEAAGRTLVHRKVQRSGNTWVHVLEIDGERKEIPSA